MKTSASPVLTEDDGQELVKLLNDVMDVAPRSLINKDLYLHYRAGDGWRVRFTSGDDEGTKDSQPSASLLDAMRAEVVPILADFASTKTRWSSRRASTTPKRRRR
jgi:hypothetical protein